MSKVILLVDDEEPVRHMFRRMLGAQGYKTIEADTAEAGWSLFLESEPDLVVTDLKMPGKDGLWLTEQIHSHDPNMPILLITAYADIGSAQRAISLGIYEFYTKPIDLHQVLGGVQRGLEFRRLVEENRSYQEELERKVEVRTQELERVYQELLQNEKLSEVGRLAAGVVHEVLNPLSVVMGRIEMVLMDPSLGEPLKKSLKLSQEQLKRAVKIMDNLRHFSRQSAPKRELMDVNELLSQTIELLAYETRQARIVVEEKFGTLPEILADKDQLSQVCLNLLKNAIDAMPDGGTLSLITTDDQEYVTVAFQDTGVGIPQDIQDKVFELFFTTKNKGTGLGLGICRGIVEAHAGQLTLKSKVGEGTVFTMTLPIVKK